MVRKGVAVLERTKTPVALFAYNRPEHVQSTLETLFRCTRLDECQLYIYCDGPKKDEHRPGTEAVRQVVREWASRLKAEVIEREQNLGLARSIVGGVTELCRQFGRAIVVEDDFALSPDFLDYMLRGLERYEETEEVYQISGYMFPVGHPPQPETFFLPLTTTWGWATWERAWRTFDWEATGSGELFSRPEVRKSFDLDESHPYAAMLEQRLAGLNDSWGILWWWNVFRRRGLVLYPHQSLVWVGGFDGSGTHCDTTTDANRESVNSFERRRLSSSFDLPDEVVPNEAALARIKEFLRQQQAQPKRSLVRRGVSALLKRLSGLTALCGVD